MRESLIARVRGLLLQPKNELPKTIAEAGDFKSLLPYVLVLVGIGAVASFLSAGVIGTYMPAQVVFGMKIGGGFFRAPVRALFGAVMSVGMGVGLWWFLGFILDALAPSFGARKDRAGALKVAAWVGTPMWLAGGLALFESVPYLGFVYVLARVAALVYAVLLGIWALPLLMGTPERKAAGHILAGLGITIVAAIVASFLLFGLVLGAIFGTAAAMLH
jgi:hypothetical protein